MKWIIFLFSLCLPLIIISQTPTVGLISHNSGSQDDGYVLFAPIRSDTTYLIDKCGNKVHQWPSARTPGLGVYLLADGSLLRTEVVVNSNFNSSGAAGGKLERIDWDGNVQWAYTMSSSTETQNHDVCPLPNGNILVAMWTNMSTSQATAAGRNPALLGTTLWSAKIIEFQPVGSSGANIVWQWDLWDHLIQEFDATKSNYGVVANHPELLNINFNGTNAATSVDWIHLNAVTYNAELNQVMFSSHNLSEIYIIDHSTTTAEAASHTGGIHGRGGDFIYRWGNPQSYNRGTSADRKLFLQHNPNWIAQGFKDAGKIMIFNNGNARPGGNASSVDIITPPVTASGDYTLAAAQAYGPTVIDWSYMDAVPTNFFSQSMGSAQRLSTGNTLICEATKGNFFEIDSLSNLVWQYINPISLTGAITQGSTNTTIQAFRAVFYPAAYSGFVGHTLTASGPLELNPYLSTCTISTGLQHINADKIGFSIYPNPASTSITVAFNNAESIKSIELINAVGQVVLNCKSTTINITELPNGIYFLQVIGNEHQYIGKLIKN